MNSPEQVNCAVRAPSGEEIPLGAQNRLQPASIFGLILTYVLDNPVNVTNDNGK
jgi:hypothetical protein